METKIDEYLKELSEDMPTNYFKFNGAINLALGLKLITQEKRELWLHRIKDCIRDCTKDTGERIWCTFKEDITTNINNYLQETWEEMQDSYPDNYQRFVGAIELAITLNLITPEKHELWVHRIKNCPDPDHTGGRIWCTYCGDILPQKEEEKD